MHFLACDGIFGYVIIVLLSFLTYEYWRFKKSRQFFDKNGIPYVKPLMLIGNLKDAFFKGRPIPWLHLDLYKELEPHKFAGYFMFHSPFIMIRDPELIKQVMIKDFNYFCDRRVNISTEVDRLCTHLAALKGEKWRNLRVKLNSAFTSGKMKVIFPLMKICGDKLAQVLENIPDEPYDIKDLCARFMTDVIGSCVFGLETHSLEDPESEFRIMGNRIFEFRFETFLLHTFPSIPQSLIKFFNLRMISKEVEDFIISFIENTVKYRQENNISRHDFIDLLLSLKNEKTIEYEDNQERANLESKSNIEMTIDLMAAQCYIFFTAGFETSSSSLSLLMLELATHQDIQNKLRDEINTSIKMNPEGLTYELLSEMPYIDMVIAEGLRMYPASGFISRNCTMDYRIPNTNVIIPKDTPVTIPTLGLHRDPEYYERPDEFYPEHFTKEAIANRPRYTYLPFGEGPRACIGKRFAIMQMKIGLVNMIKNFSFKLSSKTILPVEFERHRFLVKPKGGIWLQCEKIRI